MLSIEKVFELWHNKPYASEIMSREYFSAKTATFSVLYANN